MKLHSIHIIEHVTVIHPPHFVPGKPPVRSSERVRPRWSENKGLVRLKIINSFLMGRTIIGLARRYALKAKQVEDILRE